MSGPGKTASGGAGFLANAQVSKSVVQMEDKFESSLKLNQLSLDQQLPRRPAYGKKGKDVVVCTNYVELQLNPNETVGKYKILVQPKVVGRKLHRTIELLLRQEPFRSIKHFTDFKSTLVLFRNEDNKKFNVVYFAEDEQGPGPQSPAYHIKLQLEVVINVGQFNRSLDPTSETTFTQKQNDAMIHILNTMLYHSSRSNRNLVTVGKKSFPMAGPDSIHRDIPGSGLEAWRGYFASARLATGRVLVNVNVAYGLFYKAGTLDRLLQEFGFQGLHKLERYLKHARVMKTHLSRINEAGKSVSPMRSVFGFASPRDGRRRDGEPLGKVPEVATFGADSRKVKFWLEDRQEYITVDEYFKRNGYKLKSPDLPVINLGSREKPVYVPPELCELPSGQHAPMSRIMTKNGLSQTMIEFSVQRPAENFRLIKDHGMQTVGLFSANKILIDSNLIKVNPTLLGVKARRLDLPTIKYRKRITPTRPSWNLIGHQFSKVGQDNRSWGWLYISVQHCRSDNKCQDPKQFDGIVGELRQELVKYGIKLPEPTRGRRVALKSQDDISLDAILCAESKSLSLLWIIVPAGMEMLYDRIKQLTDVKLGLISFVSVDTKLSSQNVAQYLGNEALKINLKLGGQNQIVDWPRLHFIGDGQTMIVGIDVTHPSTDPSNGGAPSVAAMVASIDKYLAQWPAVLSVQRKRQEMVSDLQQMLVSRLKMWRSFNGSYPRYILIYRDGVSEGQYLTVRTEELPLLEAACREVYPEGASPQMSIVIVTKRHNTRFTPRNAQEADSKSNCPAGLVVDRSITVAPMWTFLLQPHMAGKGHARPGYYTVVHDQIFRPMARGRDFNPADLCQDITQSLCYSFGRCTGGVGIVTPAYYADIVCTRALCYLSALNSSASPSLDGGSLGASNNTDDEITDDRRQQLQDACQTHENLRKVMFYI